MKKRKKTRKIKRKVALRTCSFSKKDRYYYLTKNLYKYEKKSIQ